MHALIGAKGPTLRRLTFSGSGLEPRGFSSGAIAHLDPEITKLCTCIYIYTYLYMQVYTCAVILYIYICICTHGFVGLYSIWAL